MNRLSRLAPLPCQITRAQAEQQRNPRGSLGLPLATSFHRENQPSPRTSQTRTCPSLRGTCVSSAAFAEGPCQGHADRLPATPRLRRPAASGPSPGSAPAATLNLADSTAHSWPLPRRSRICHLRVALPGVPRAKTGQPGEPAHIPLGTQWPASPLVARTGHTGQPDPGICSGEQPWPRRLCTLRQLFNV